MKYLFLITSLALCLSVPAQRKTTAPTPKPNNDRAAILDRIAAEESKTRLLGEEEHPIIPSAEWKLYYFQDIYKNYFNSSKFIRTGKDTVKVWERRQLRANNDNHIQRLLGSRKRLGMSTEGWQNYSHSLDQLELQCTQKQIRFLYSIDYATNGATLFSINNPEGPWMPVIPDSAGEWLLKLVCVDKKKE